MGVLLILATGVLMLVCLFRPKAGPILIWPVLFCYPHAYWAEINPLPLGAGFDDVFIILIAALLILRKGYFQFTWAVKIVLLFAMIIAFANATFVIRYGISGEATGVMISEVLKTLIFALLAFSVANAADNEEDLRRLVRIITISIMVAAVTVIISRYSPQFAQAFGSPTKRVNYASETYRAAGALAEPNTVGGVMAVGICLAIMMLSLSHGLWRRMFFLGGIAVMVVAVLFSRSRSGLLGIGAILPSLLLLRGFRKWAVAGFCLMAVSVVAFPTLYEPVFERLAGSSGELAADAEGSRVNIWLRHLHNIDALDLVMGQSHIGARAEAGGAQPHSGYLDLICYYGIWGVLWFLIVMVGLGRRVSFAYKTLDSVVIRAFGQTALLYIIVLLWFAITADAFGPGTFELMLFCAMLGLADRVAQLVRERQDYQESNSGLPAAAFAWPASV